MLKEFREFAMRGNVVDLAVGLILGAAFGAIVTSFVNDVIMPPVGMLLGGVDFANLFVLLKAGKTATAVRQRRHCQGRRRSHPQHRRLHQHDHQLRLRCPLDVRSREGHECCPADDAASAGRAAAAGKAAGRDSGPVEGARLTSPGLKPRPTYEIA